MKFIKKTVVGTLFLGVSLSASAFDAFTVHGIRFSGLHRIDSATVKNYLPIKAGQNLNADSAANVIQTLYNTGFFKDVSLERQGNDLVIMLVEQPTIASIKITGNNAVPSDKLKTVMKELGVLQGRVFSHSAITQLKYSLQNQYDQLGQYSATVDTIVTPLARDRVELEIKVSEGLVTKIAKIQIVGNKIFSQRELLKQFKLTTPNLWSFMNKDDQYTPEKLEADLEHLRSFYFDRGYLNFKVNSSQVMLTPNKKQIYLTVNVTEGDQYRIQGFKLEGNLLIPRDKLLPLIPFKPTQVFSRQEIIDVQKTINQEFTKQGYAFSNIQVIPTLDEKTHTVFLTFKIEPGRQIYVRRINFIGNTKTEDKVLRSAMQQMEGGLVNSANIDESTRMINNLGFVKHVQQELVAVENANDQADLNIHVEEQAMAQVTGTIGYSTTEKIVFGLGFTQFNFLGTGKEVGLNFNNSSYTREYSASFNDPYYTMDGVSRGFSIFARSYKPSAINLTTGYTYDIFGGSLNYGIPLTTYDRIGLSVGLQKVKINVGSMPSVEIAGFTNQYGKQFNDGILNASWSHTTYDRLIFPTQGLEQIVSGNIWVPLGQQALKYYKINYRLQGYHPLTESRSLIFVANGGVGYGNGYGNNQGLPFFANYFSGGIDSDAKVAGFDPNTLGPRDSQGNPYGGNVALYATAGIILPEFNENVRTMAFINAGNVYNTTSFNNGTQTVYVPGRKPGVYIEGESVNLNQIRYSAGISLEWRSFIGPLQFSLAKPFTHKGDRSDPFQFTIGANF